MENHDFKIIVDKIIAGLAGTDTQLRLGDMTRRVEAALRTAGMTCRADRVTTRFVADRLRMMGFKRTGWHGHGYDREPVYSRAKPAQ